MMGKITGAVMKRRIIPLLASLWLVTMLPGCNSQGVRSDKATWLPIPAGSQVVLHEPLEIRAHHTRVFLQGGEVIYSGDMDQYYANCNFEVRERLDKPQTIESGRFMITSVQLDEDVVVGISPPQYAGLKMTSWKSYGPGKPTIAKVLHHRLASEAQSQVMRLSCRGGFADEAEAEWPTLGEIRAVLGDKASIELNP
jgi:hypothetical protein